MVMCVTLAAGTAAADGQYGGFGFGGGAVLTGGIAERFSTSGQVNGRIIGGARRGPFAVEGAFFGTDLHGKDSSYDKRSTFSLGIDFKAYLPLSAEGLEAYVRAGLSHTWLAAEQTSASTLSGRSYEYGLGLQYSLRQLRVIQGAFWFDYNHQVLWLSGDKTPVGGDIHMFTFGFSVGTGL
jgi:hypothetical protein